MLIRSKFRAETDNEVRERPLFTQNCNFNPYIVINIAFRDFPPQQYDDLNDTHSK